MDEQFIRERLTELRLHKDVSEYQMSLDIGKSQGYIHKIASGKSLPSMKEFLNICEYLDVLPQDFFADGNIDPVLCEINSKAARLNEKDREFILVCLNHLLEK